MFFSHFSWGGLAERLSLYFPWLGTACWEWAKMVACWARDCIDADRHSMIYKYLFLNSREKGRKKWERRAHTRWQKHGWWNYSTCATVSCIFLSYFQLHFTHKHEITQRSYASAWMPTKDTLAVWVLLFTALATHDRDMGYIMVENSWSWFPGLIRTKYKVSASIWAFTWKWKGEFSHWCWIRVQKQHDTLMKGVFAFTGCPSGCDFKRCHACQHKAMIKLLRVVIGSILKYKKKDDWHNITVIQPIAGTWTCCCKHNVAGCCTFFFQNMMYDTFLDY